MGWMPETDQVMLISSEDDLRAFAGDGEAFTRAAALWTIPFRYGQLPSLQSAMNELTRALNASPKMHRPPFVPNQIRTLTAVLCAPLTLAAFLCAQAAVRGTSRRWLPPKTSLPSSLCITTIRTPT